MMEVLTDRPILDRVAYVARERFAWPGGYALGLLMADGGALCSACVAAEVDLITPSTADDDGDQWTAAAAYVADEDDDGGYDDDGGPPATCCDHCGRPVSDATTQRG